MAGNTIGEVFKVTTFGESHGAAVGAVIDGCPAGLCLGAEDIQTYLDRRKPGASPYATARKESDAVHILSGVFDGVTTGTPICALIYNEDHKSADYSAIKDIYRPAHADFTYQGKYGVRDYRGGGRSSGRETAGRVIGGAVAGVMLKKLDITARAYVAEIGGIAITGGEIDGEAAAYLDKIKEERDSAGGVVECVITGCPIGLGEPVFDKLGADLAKAVMSIGAARGVEFGAGFAASRLKGSANNAQNADGILGGISNGQPITLRVAFKPTPSIGKPQKALGADGKWREITIAGRHDPVIALRAAVVVEAMVNIVLADHALRGAASNMDKIQRGMNA